MATRRPLVLVAGELKELPAGDTMPPSLLGATTVGTGLLSLPNPSALSFLRVNADNTVSALAATDFRTAIGAQVARTIVGTANQVTVTNGDGVAGNPTLSLPQDVATTSSPTFAGATIRGVTSLVTGPSQFSTALDIQESTHATSRRAGLNLGKWMLFQDPGGVGTRSFCLYDSLQGMQRLIVNTSGNVGVNNTNPLRKLDVVSDSNGNGIRITGTTGTIGAFTAEGTSVNIQADSAAATRVLVDAGTLNASGYVVMNGGSSGYVQLGTGGTPKLQVFASGIVKLNNYTAGVLVTDSTGVVTATLSPAVTNLSATGTITVNSSASPAGSVRNITISTAAPSGGADGDVWFQYAS